MKKAVGRVLKEQRELAGYTVSEVSELLAALGLKGAPKTIYGWERGHSEPPADTLIALCDLYGVTDILGAFGYAQKKPPAEAEGIKAEVLAMLREMEPEDAAHLVVFAEFLLSRRKASAK